MHRLAIRALHLSAPPAKQQKCSAQNTKINMLVLCNREGKNPWRRWPKTNARLQLTKASRALASAQTGGRLPTSLTARCGTLGWTDGGGEGERLYKGVPPFGTSLLLFSPHHHLILLFSCPCRVLLKLLQLEFFLHNRKL